MLKRGSKEHREQGRAEMDQRTLKRRTRSVDGWGSFRGGARVREVRKGTRAQLEQALKAIRN